MKKVAEGFFIVISLVGIWSCSNTMPTGRRASELADPVVQERKAKDEAFRQGKNSPIPPEQRAAFRGLAYFPPDPGLRFTVRLQRYSRPEQVRLGTNTGEIRLALSYGYFEFQIGDHICRLQGYRLEDAPGSEPYLFIPFRDATSGRETYGAGRYIDLKENTTGIYELDFNRAYNPFCAYNEQYSCPLAPEENTLKVAIRAGEKIYAP